MWLALKDKVTVNVDDVKSDPHYLSCSVETKSEIVIPLSDKEGNFIAELDIDSQGTAAFTKEIEKEMLDYCLSFSAHF